MKHYLAALISAAALFALQFSIFPLFISDPFRPDLLLVAVVITALNRDGFFYAAAVYAAGLLQDSFSGIYTGLNAFSYLVIFLLIRRVADNLYSARTNVLLFSVAVATLLNSALHLILLTIFSTHPGVYLTIFKGVIPQVAVNSFIASIFTLIPFKPFAKVER